MPVIPVLHLHPPPAAGGIEHYEIGCDWKQMGLISDLHVIPRYFVPAFEQSRTPREFAGFFVQLDYVAAQTITDIVDEDVPGARGIVSLVFNIEGAEASIRRRIEPVFQ